MITLYDYLSSVMSSRGLPKLKLLVSKESAAMNIRQHFHLHSWLRLLASAFQRKYHETKKN